MAVPTDPPPEQLIPLTEAPGRLPRRRGKKVHYSTVFRWATKGARGRVLESQLIGGVRYTTLAALRHFLDTEVREAADATRAEQLRQFLYGQGPSPEGSADCLGDQDG